MTTKMKNTPSQSINGILVILSIFNAKVRYSYLFVHDGIKNIPRAERTLDKYWKGIVKGIRWAPFSASRKRKDRKVSICFGSN